jgi:hypothetical protein
MPQNTFGVRWGGVFPSRCVDVACYRSGQLVSHMTYAWKVGGLSCCDGLISFLFKVVRGDNLEANVVIMATEKLSSST